MKYEEISIDDISPRGMQVREIFDKEELKELSDNIKEMGVIQPILVVERARGRYEIVAGERRWKACKQAGVSTIPAIIMDTQDEGEILEKALAENIMRADLTPIERENAVYELWMRFGAGNPENKNPKYGTMAEISRKFGKSDDWASRLIESYKARRGIKSVGTHALYTDEVIVIKNLDDKTKNKMAEALAENKLSRDGHKVREIAGVLKEAPEKARPHIVDALAEGVVQVDEVKKIVDVCKDEEEVKTLLEIPKTKGKTELHKTISIIERSRKEKKPVILKEIVKDEIREWNWFVSELSCFYDANLKRLKPSMIKGMDEKHKREVKRIIQKIEEWIEEAKRYL
jgi:ParB/RepB/Spo0J family partition protein